MEQKTLKILFFGDITGRQGRNAIKSFLSSSNLENTFVIANIENASHGFGLTKKNYSDLSESGINCFTSGNHIWDKKDIYEYINDSKNLVRPINYPCGTPGKGSQTFEINGFKIAVINVLGRVFMPPMDSPWQIVVEEIRKLKNEGVEHIFIDFHAEATAEKICFSKFLANEFNTEEKALIKGFWGHILTYKLLMNKLLMVWHILPTPASAVLLTALLAWNTRHHSNDYLQAFLNDMKSLKAV